MSTSVYRSEQLVHYQAEPVTYYGWYISWSGGEDDSGYPFTCAERREEWAKAVRERFPELDGYDAELLAAMVALAAWGPESARDGIWWALLDRFGELSEEDGDVQTLTDELASAFDPSGPPGSGGSCA